MIEITLENLLTRMDSLNKHFFNLGSKTRIYVTPVEISPNSYLKGSQFEIRKYNIDDVPILSTVLKIGDKSEVFNYQQAVFDTIKMLEKNTRDAASLLKKSEKKGEKMSDKNEFISK